MGVKKTAYRSSCETPKIRKTSKLLYGEYDGIKRDFAE